MLFAHSYDFVKNTVLSWKNYGPIGLPEVTGIPAFTFVVAFIVCGMLLLAFWTRKVFKFYIEKDLYTCAFGKTAYPDYSVFQSMLSFFLFCYVSIGHLHSPRTHVI